MTDTTFLTPFDFQENQVRTAIDAEGNEWFCAVDVAEILGIEWHSRSKKRFFQGTYQTLSHETPSGRKWAIYLRHPAVYQMAFKSNKPEAREFTFWLCNEVLPELSKYRSSSTVDLTTKQRLITIKEINNIVRELKQSRCAFTWALLPQLLESLCKLINCPMPDLDQFTHEPSK